MMIADALSPSPTSFLALTLNSYVAPFSKIIRVNSEHSFFKNRNYTYCYMLHFPSFLHATICK